MKVKARFYVESLKFSDFKASDGWWKSGKNSKENSDAFITYLLLHYLQHGVQTNKQKKKKTQNKTTHRVRVVVVFGLSFGGFCVQSFCQGFFQVAFHHVCFPVSQSKQGKPSFQHLYD